MKTSSRGIFLIGLLFAQMSFAMSSGLNVVSGKRVVFPNPSAKATVYVFLSVRCPCSNGHEEALRAISEEFSRRGFEFIGVHANQNETPEEARQHFKNVRLPFPVIDDSSLKLADEFRALKTPHVFVRKGETSLFEGGVDDTSSGVNSTKHYLRNALMEIDAGKPVSEPRVRVLGCVIRRMRS